MLPTIITIAAIVVGVAICVHHIRDSYEWIEALFRVLFTVAVTALVWWLVLLLAAFMVPPLLGANTTAEAEYDLRALTNGTERDGSFFLGSGRVDGEQMYSYLYEQVDGGYRLAQVDADVATVYTDEQHDPYVTIEWRISDHWWVGTTAVLGTSVEFHIPEGTVAHDYEVAP